MAQAISSRVKRIVSGSINALIDAAEGINPQIVMKESIREVESVILQIRHEMGKVVVEKTRLQKQIDEQTDKHNALLEQIKIALKEGREDLAQAGASKQINIEEQLPILKSSLADTKEQIIKYEEYIKALQAKKRDMEEELSLHQKELNSVVAGGETSVNAAQEAFHRVMGVKTLDLDLQEQSKLDELDELARKNQIDERLEALRNTIDD